MSENSVLQFRSASARAIGISAGLGSVSAENIPSELQKLRAQYFLMLAAAERLLIEERSDIKCSTRADLPIKLLEDHIKPVLESSSSAAGKFFPGTVAISMATVGLFHCSAAWLCHIVRKPVVTDKQQLARWRQMRTSLGTYRKDVLSKIQSVRDTFDNLGSILPYSGARLRRVPPRSSTAWEEIKSLYSDPNGYSSMVDFFASEYSKSPAGNSGAESSESEFEEDIPEEAQLATLEAKYSFGPVITDILYRTATRLNGSDSPLVAAELDSEITSILTLERYATECSTAELAFLDCREGRKGKGAASTDLEKRKSRYAKLHAVLTAVWDSYYRLYQPSGREAGVYTTVADLTGVSSSKGKESERASDSGQFDLQRIHNLGLHNKAFQRLAEPLLGIYTHKENRESFATEAQSYLAIALGHAALLAHCWYPKQGAMDRDDRWKAAWERQLQDLVQFPEEKPTTAPPDMTLRYEFFYDELKELKLRDLYFEGKVKKCNPGYLHATVREFLEKAIGNGDGTKEDMVEKLVEKVNGTFFTEAWVKEFQSQTMDVPN